MHLTQTPPLSLYIHLPWCQQKCPYCDFNSHETDNFDEYAYINRLVEDLQLDLPLIWGRQIISIFIGGGTPSLFSAPSIAELLSHLRACLNFNPGIEITLEANPGSADEIHFTGYREAGINRLSLGIQSFNDDFLKSLGRIHDREQAISAFSKARNAGFDNINLDLMYALPGQNLSQAQADIFDAIALQPEHISHYQLTIEPNTLFHHQCPENLPDNDASFEMQHRCQALLAHQGYQQYEISAYAREGHESHHNLNYWHFGDYTGIGAGAHGKITLPAEHSVIRRVRTRQPRAYLQQSPATLISHQHLVSEQDLVFEFMLNALRLIEGFDTRLFEQHTGLSFQLIEPPVKKAIDLGLLVKEGHCLKPTHLGLRFLNDLQTLFMDIDLQTGSQVKVTTNFY